MNQISDAMTVQTEEREEQIFPLFYLFYLNGCEGVWGQGELGAAEGEGLEFYLLVLGLAAEGFGFGTFGEGKAVYLQHKRIGHGIHELQIPMVCLRIAHQTGT